MKAKPFFIPLILTLPLVGLLSACDGAEDSSDTIATTSTNAQDSSTACEATQSITASEDFDLSASFTRLPELSGLLGLYQEPGKSDRWYALLRNGSIVRFHNSETVSTVETFLTIDNVRTRSEMGLLGFAFHPNYAQNGKVYLSYNDQNNKGDSTISEFTSINGAAIDNATQKPLLTHSQPAQNHNGGDIKFGPDGYLYIALGDGGAANDKFGHGQRTSSLLGTVLRIDVDNPQAPRKYGIPKDNPFVNKAGYLPEIYAYGLRNPWRFSFDQKTGDLWVADVGQNKLEEVNIIQAGENMGWPIMEGFDCFQASSCDKSGLAQPVMEYPHAGRHCSITGGYVYRSDRLTALNGNYLFADWCSGVVWRSYTKNNRWEMQEIADMPFYIPSFAQGNDGEVYVLNIEGTTGHAIYRITSDKQKAAGCDT